MGRSFWARWVERQSLRRDVGVVNLAQITGATGPAALQWAGEGRGGRLLSERLAGRGQGSGR